MKEIRIDWKAVKIRMAQRDVPTLLMLANATGISKNTLSQRKAAFVSTTVDRLANYLECDPTDLVTSVEVNK